MEHIGAITLGECGNEIRIHLLKHAEASKASNHGRIEQLAKEGLLLQAVTHLRAKPTLHSIDLKKFKTYADVWKRIEDKKPPEYEVSHIIGTVDGSSFAVVFTPLAKRRQ